jgi:hypothetical protein
VVLEPDDRLRARHRVERRTDRRERLDDPCMNATVDDAIGLQMMRRDIELRDDLVPRRALETETHRGTPTIAALVDDLSQVSRRRGAHAGVAYAS